MLLRTMVSLWNHDSKNHPFLGVIAKVYFSTVGPRLSDTRLSDTLVIRHILALKGFNSWKKILVYPTLFQIFVE